MFLFIFASGPFKTNALLLGCPVTKEGAIIDPAPGSAPLLQREAQKHSFRLTKLLLTHSHWDHIADAHLFDLPIYVHPLDAANLTHPGSDGLPLFIPIQPAKPTHFLQEGETVSVGHIQLQVLHTPGHCPGAVCFYSQKENVLIAGDTLFKGGIGNLHLPTGQPELMQASLAKLAKLPPQTRVIPGHGPETTIGQEFGKG